jgi:transcriptional regulator with XRE-family HTH domain
MRWTLPRSPRILCTGDHLTVKGKQGSGEDVVERIQLIEARTRKHWTLEQEAEQLEVDTDTVCRWEKGKTNPRGYNLQRICEVYGMSAARLGLVDAPSPDDSASEMPVFSEAGAPRDDDGMLAELLQQDLSLRLIRLVWTWPRGNRRYEELQGQIMKETEQFDSIINDADHPLTRRDALRRLALLPVEMYGLTTLVGTLRQPAEEFLPLCAASITACWYLMSGSDFTLVEHVLPHYLPRLEALAKQPSRMQKEAARLASHGHLLLGIAVLQHNDVQGCEQHNKQAITYAAISEDKNLEVAALIRQGDTYFHSASPVLELEMFQQAAQYIHEVLPVQQASVGQSEAAQRSLRHSPPGAQGLAA